MITTRRFIQCDVFTSTPYRGNALAVVVDAHGMDEAAMRRFAAWTNLAETTFILPPTDPSADYRVRIFTPSREMPFAGHPTLGTCATWLHTGGIPRDPQMVRQQCEIGIVEIDQSGDTPAFVAPPTVITDMADGELNRVADILDIDRCAIVRNAQLENGPVWQAFELRSARDVLALDSSRVRWPDYKALGFIGRHDEGAECDYEVRMLAPSSGMSEDPITGSLNAALAQWFAQTDTLSQDLMIAQGTQIERLGRVSIRRDTKNPERIMIGGRTHILIEGSVTV